MARTQQDTVLYFPHDTAASDGDTMTIIEANFGNDGYAFWFKLLEKLGRTNGHYIDCNNQVKMDLLAAKSHITGSKAITILEMLSQLGAIDKALWQNKIIWCQHLVDNVADVYTNRKRTPPAKPEIITTSRNENDAILNPSISLNDGSQLSPRETPPKTIISSSNSITTNSNSTDIPKKKITTRKNRQSKVDESKRKMRATAEVETIKDVFFSFKNENRYCGIDFENDFVKMCEWYHGQKKKVSNPTLACHNWLDHTLENMAKNNGHNKQQVPAFKYQYVNETVEDDDDN